ncbi:PP2C family serine/threonine-protein phosphatase [Streptomyces sp. NPDC004647]|uniref:PP2C family serine/threonine-protein phosphatase n=1 Tax=Streptomyces sp. NPDC004647 TaxID=3154671 RepID=UPI0033A11D63
MPKVPQLSACPSCDEPLETGDNFCGACGADLSVPQTPSSGDRPTVALNGTGRPTGRPARADGGVPGPASSPTADGRPGPPPPEPGTRLPDPVGGSVAVPPPHVPPLPGHPPTVPPGPETGAGAAAAAQSGTAPVRPPVPVPPPPPTPPAPGAADAASVPPPPEGPPAVPAPAAHAAPVDWPAPETDGRSGAQETHRPEDLPGSDSGGSPLPGHPVPGADAEPQDHSPAAPGTAREHAPADPRTAAAYGTTEPVRTVTDTPGGAGGAAPADGHGPSPAGDGSMGGSSGGGIGGGGGGGKVCVACRTGLIDQDGYCENCGHAQPRKRDHLEQELDSLAAVSDRGLRHHRNEDAFAVSSVALPDGVPAVVAVVCDGVSSATRPDEASLAASEAASESLLTALPRGTHPQQAMHEAILAAAQAVNSLVDARNTAQEQDQHRHQNAPACTIVSAVVAAGILTVGWIGDSRVYWVPDDRTAPSARLTEDDSWAAQMVATGLMSEAEAYADERAHAITGWLGADAYELDPHTASFKPDRPGVVVVCTDGLWNYAEAAEEMAQAVPADARSRPLHGARTLVGYALDGGGHDNVTVAVVPFPGPAAGAGSA